jgi:hypothetical protein
MSSEPQLALWPARPALKRVIRVETLSQSAKALLPPHKCGGSHQVKTTPAVRETTLSAARVGAYINASVTSGSA